MLGKELVIQEKYYYSQADEDAFYDRLNSLRCVRSIQGTPDGVHIALSRAPTDSQLRELIALLYRYDLDMTPLAAFRTKRNAPWFSENRDAFWHSKVFQTSKRQSRTKRRSP
jgi:hypothetical protein